MEKKLQLPEWIHMSHLEQTYKDRNCNNLEQGNMEGGGSETIWHRIITI